MIYVLGSGSSAKISHEYGFWRVDFPVGSSCTLTNGPRTYKAPDDAVSIGRYTFPIPESGSWTVRCTDGTDTASKTISFSDKYIYYVTTLAYTTYYYNKGDKCTAVTGGWSKTGTGGSLTFNSASMTLVANSAQNLTDASTTNKVSLANIKTLYFSVKSATTYGTQGNPRVGVATTNNPKSNDASQWSASKTLSASSSFTTVSIDVSSMTGSYYIVAGGFNGDAGPATIEIQAIWGED